MPDADHELCGEAEGLYEGEADDVPLGGDAPSAAAAAARARDPEGRGVAGLEIEYDLEDFSDDEVLLDWEQYAGMRRVTFCGVDCTSLVEALPCDLPPAWWYRFSRRQRKAFTNTCSIAGCLAVLALVLVVILPWVLRGQSSEAAAPPPPQSTDPSFPPPPPPVGLSGVGPSGSPAPEATAPPGQPPAAPSELLDLCSWADFRLPKEVRPTAYDLQFDLSGMRKSSPDAPVAVKGSVAITVEASRAVRCVPLHAEVGTMALAIATLRSSADGGVLHGTVKRSDAFDSNRIVIVDFGEGSVAGPGELVLELQFSYTLGSSLDGLYMSNFTGADGAQGRMAVTQFEATAARKAFPCFDEPSLKAKFSISVIAATEMTVLSNMPERRSGPAGSIRDAVKHEFEQSPLMSTYLVAIVAGELTSTSVRVPASVAAAASPEEKDRVVSVWGTPGKEKYLQAALGFAKAALRKYEEMLGIPYALPKMDLVAIPDFSAGAMENWGLITYRETDLLVLMDDDSASSIKRVAMVVAHEIAHQWFGNLVTMRYWGDLWLNEGFATYFEYIGASAALQEEFPELDVWEYFFADVAARAMRHDSMADTTEPLSMDDTGIGSTEQIESFFNSVPYDKGGSVLRMLRAWMARDMDEPGYSELGSSDPLMAALSKYLAAHAHGSATSSDLVKSIETPGEDDLPGMLSKWLYNKYVPMILVDVNDYGDDPDGSVVISQRPIPPAGGGCEVGSAGSRDDSAPWQVPVSFITAEDDRASWLLLRGCISAAPLHTLKGPSDFVKLNAGQVGLYRVSYSEPLWERLISAAHSSSVVDGGGSAPRLSDADLAGLMSDSYSQATHGEADITVFLRLLHSLGDRTLGLEPWLVAYDALHDMRTKLRGVPGKPECSEGLAAVVRKHILAGFVPLGSTSDPLDADRSNLRQGTAGLSLASAGGRSFKSRVLEPLLLSLAATFGDKLVPADAARELGSRSSDSIRGDIRYTVYKLAAMSSPEGWESVLEVYRASTSATEKDQALMALGAAEGDPALLDRALQMALSDEVRSQDTVRLIVRVGANGGAALDAAVAFAREHWQRIGEKYGSKTERSHQLGRLFGVAGGYATQERLEWASEWWESTAKDDVGETDYYLNSVLDSIKENMAWMRLNLDPACQWLVDPANQ